MLCEEKFFSTYNHAPENIAFCPYRICPLGAHVDHQKGKITGLAIDKGIFIAYGKKHNGVIELSSLQFDKRAQFHIADVPKQKQNDWADHLRGATLALKKRFELSSGICGVIEGTLPIGGLSSSAAVIIAFLSALCHVNNIVVSKEQLIQIALEAENDYVGVSCGKLDQSCEVYCKKDHLLYLDNNSGSYELIPTNKNMKPYKIAVFFSGLERSLASSKFNMRVDECRAAAYALMAFSNKEYGKFDQACLRDVPYETFVEFKNKLPLPWASRAEHYYTEQKRVELGAQAWRNGDLDEFGKLCFESGRSSIYNYQTGSPELKKLYEIMLDTDGIYGGRFSGAGFKGCCMALIDPEKQETVLEKVQHQYIQAFPELKDKYSACICASADGVIL